MRQGAAWVGLVVVIVIAVVVFFVVRRCGSEPIGGETETITWEEFKQQAQQADAGGLIYLNVRDEGWVTEARPSEDGGWTLLVDMDESGAEGATPDVVIDVPEANATGAEPEPGTRITWEAGGARRVGSIFRMEGWIVSRG